MNKPISPWGCGSPEAAGEGGVRPSAGALVPVGRERDAPGAPGCGNGEGAEKEQPDGGGRRKTSGLQVCGLGASWMHNQAEMYNDTPRSGCANVFTSAQTQV